MSIPAIPIVPTPRKCKLCRQPGHRSTTCPAQRVPILAVVPDPPAAEQGIPAGRLEAIAELRARFDALAVEIAEYERVRAIVDIRIAESHQRRAALAVEIKQLRGGQ